MKRAALVLALAATLAGCGSSSSPKPKPSSTKLVWCVEPGEKATPEWKREYPERHMTEASCHFWLTGEAPKP